LNGESNRYEKQQQKQKGSFVSKDKVYDLLHFK
jgi:hypothetical protein